MRAIRTEIEIKATPQRVWSLLTDFAAFPRWNPFVQTIEGTPAAGQRLSVLIGSAGGRAMKFKPQVLKADVSRELRWLGRLAIPGLFSGEHSFTIEPAGEGRVRFVQAEVFRGLLLPLLWKSLNRDTRAGFAAMNQALKTRAEAPV